MSVFARPAAVAGLLVLSVAASGLAAAAPRQKARDVSTSSGIVTLRTTDDAGLCASTPTAVTAPSGAPCPTFPLYYALPKGKPAGLVVVFHGHGHNGEQYVAQLAQFAADNKVVAVAMATDELASNVPSYRGPFDSVDAEARDAAAAISWAREEYHTGTKTYLLGVSMGGSGLAYFLDAASRPTAGDTDAAWVQGMKPLPLAGMVDAEGISNLPETWAEATGFDKFTAAEIEKENGGTPTTAPAAYRARSLALLPTSAWKASGLPVVAVVHDVDDGLVPYNQTIEARAAVLAASIRLLSFDIVFKDSCSQGNQTTATSVLTGVVPGFPVGQSEATLCLAGHANENDGTTPVMEEARKALQLLVAGDTLQGETLYNPTHP